MNAGLRSRTCVHGIGPPGHASGTRPVVSVLHASCAFCVRNVVNIASARSAEAPRRLVGGQWRADHCLAKRRGGPASAELRRREYEYLCSVVLGEVTARLAEIVCGVAASCEEFGGVSLEEGVASVHAAREILQGFATAGHTFPMRRPSAMLPRTSRKPPADQ